MYETYEIYQVEKKDVEASICEQIRIWLLSEVVDLKDDI